MHTAQTPGTLPQTPKALLIDHRLRDATSAGEGLMDVIANLRDAGKFWPEIAATVSELSGVRVSHEIIRQWGGAIERGAA